MEPHRCLYLKFFSAGLSAAPKRLNAVVSVLDREKNLIFPEEKSEVREDGGSVIFYISMALIEDKELDLVVQLKSKRIVHHNADIGVVCVPIAELVQGFGDGTEDHEKPEKVTSKSFKTPEGKAGTLKFSYKVGRILQEPPKELKMKFRKEEVKKAANELIKKLAIRSGFAVVIALLEELLD